MEGQPVVDPEDHVVDKIVKDVTALAVGVVREHVEGGELSEAVMVGFDQREVVLFGVVLDEALHGSDAEWPLLPEHGHRHDTPAERARQLVRGHLALAERAVGEVPQRPLTTARLVDGRHRHAVGGDLGKERSVRRVAEPADELDLAAAEDLRDLVGVQFQRGHRWPAGSIGMPQSGHGGRPASTTAAPRAAIARTCGRVA